MRGPKKFGFEHNATESRFVANRCLNLDFSFFYQKGEGADFKKRLTDQLKKLLKIKKSLKNKRYAGQRKNSSLNKKIR